MAQKILVVDDEASITDLVCDLLQAEGYRTCACYSGAEALAARCLGQRGGVVLVLCQFAEQFGTDPAARGHRADVADEVAYLQEEFMGKGMAMPSSCVKQIGELASQAEDLVLDLLQGGEVRQ